MQWRAGSALSPHVVRVDPQSRPCDVTGSIEESRATHAVVFQGRDCLGVVSVREAQKYAPRRPFGELLAPSLPEGVSDDMPLEDVARRLADSDVDAVVVSDEGGAYLGVVTRQSLLAALLAQNGALAREEARLRTVLDHVPAIISQFDLEWRHVFVNRAAPGMAVQDIVGRHITHVIPPEFQALLMPHLEQVTRDLQPVRFEFPGVGPQATTVMYAGRMAPLLQNGRLAGLISVVIDATDSRKIEQALRESEQRLQEVVNNAPVILFALDRHGFFTLSEGRGLAAKGVLPGSAVGTSALERYRDSPQMLTLVKRALAGEEFNSIADHSGRAYDCHVRPIFGSSGEFSGVIGVATDITERRQAELGARWYTQIVEHIGLGLYVVKLEADQGRYTLRNVNANPASERLTKIKAANWIGKTIDESYPGLRSRGLVEMVRQVVETGVPLEFEQFHYGDDKLPPTDWAFMIFPLPEGHAGVAFQDVTQRRQAERQSRRLLDELAQTSRVSTLGEMASGLAHELNQPLAAIVAYVDACLELVEAGKMDARQLAEVLQSVSSQAERAGQIIHRLRKMIRRSQPVRAGMSVNDAIRELTGLMEAEARRSGVVIDLKLAVDVPEVAADFLQIQHVVLNLMRNGLEAMTDVAADLRRLIIASKATAGGEVEVAVCDVGHGLQGATPAQVFEPFFSTKPNGLGLGLSISRTIVEAHGGRIWMTSNAPRGVTAGFTLPSGSGKLSQ